MSETDYEVVEERVPSVEQGEPQEVRVDVVVKYDAEEYGMQRCRVRAEFHRSSQEDGFLWANATPIRSVKHAEATDTTGTFHTFHITGVERAVEYIEEHYGPVTSGYPSMVQ